MRRIKDTILLWIKQIYWAIRLRNFRRKHKKDEIKWDYSQDKAKYISLKGQRKKMKLRQHIRSVAEEITKVSTKPYVENRATIIQFYNNYGLHGMHEKLIEEFDKFLK